jgi:MFS superfamily sulfate permease-like transporter
MPLPKISANPPAAPVRNRYDRMEWAGAFGDLGTLLPFFIAYISVLKMDPLGILFAFGVSMVVCGLYFKTPFPVQPMKAIGAVAALQAAQNTAVTPEVVYAAALVTGVIWLVLGVTGLATQLARWVPPPVVSGIILGLGLGFMLEGTKLMQTGWWVAAVAGIGMVVLLGNRKFPAMFVLLAFGVLVGAWQRPELLAALADTPVQVRLPGFALAHVGWEELLVGAVLLALPQVPLTLGNAVIAIRQENNRLFPQAPVTEKGVSISTGLMNLFSAAVGGIPLCLGAGGMAGHIAFGARTGGAVVILGGLLLVLAVFFSGSVEQLLQLLPAAVLGVILFLTGVQLARGGLPANASKAQAFVTLATAGMALWNVAIAFGVGIVLWHVARRGHLDT